MTNKLKMKKKQTNLTKIAATLARKIELEYSKLNNDDPNFFETYHDNVRCQMDCAYQIAGEVEIYVEKDDLKSAKEQVKDLQDTLKYCKAVIELQKQTVNLPKCIFG